MARAKLPSLNLTAANMKAIDDKLRKASDRRARIDALWEDTVVGQCLILFAGIDKVCNGEVLREAVTNERSWDGRIGCTGDEVRRAPGSFRFHCKKCGVEYRFFGAPIKEEED